MRAPPMSLFIVQTQSFTWPTTNTLRVVSAQRLGEVASEMSDHQQPAMVQSTIPERPTWLLSKKSNQERP